MLAYRFNFRAWDKIYQIMHEKVLPPDSDGLVKLDYCFIPPTNEKKLDGIPEDTVVVMQSTGMLDKNDKEIYEGDILLFDNNLKKQFYANVVFKNCSWQYEFMANYYRQPRLDTDNLFNATNLHTIEIVGNIFENPNLLNKR